MQKVCFKIPDDVTGVGLGPEVVGPEGPVVHLGHLVKILQADYLAPNVHHLLHPVVLHRIVHLK